MDFEKMMTVYYKKRNGQIIMVSSGVQDMSTFGEDEDDFTSIYNFIVVEQDENIVRTPHDFMVDSGRIKLKNRDEIERYL